VRTTGEVRCPALTSSGEPANGTNTFRWEHKGNQVSFGELVIPFTESGEVAFSGTITSSGSGTFFGGMHLSGKLAMHFGPCAGKAKVHKGTFTSSEFVVS
jgi:hypothetical protein